MKKTSFFKVLPAICGSFLLSSILVLAQGSLTPPGAPAPTMKTLSQIEPRTPISSLPFLITTPGSYYLTTNVTGTSGNNGIVITTNDVHLDLNGFTLFGVTGSGTGILVNNSYTNITICNGTVKLWNGSGVDAYSYGYPRNVLLERLTVSDCLGSGVLAEAQAIVRDCLSLNNGNHGFLSDGAMFINCVARNNAIYGFSLTHSTLHSCMASFNGQYGIYADDTTVMDCDVLNNTNSGVFVGNSCHIVNNRIANHTGNPGDGLYVSGRYSVIANNSVLNNTYGIYCYSTGTNDVIVQNKFIGNPYTSTSIYDICPMSYLNASTAQNATNANAW